MATFFLIVNNEQGQPLNGVIIVGGEYNTSPVPFGYNATTGPGQGWNGTTGANGQIAFNVPYTCVGSYSGTLKASGYDDYPFSYTSGYVTGDFYQTVQMTAASVNGGGPLNSGANTTAGNLSDQVTATSTGISNGLSTDMSNLFGGQTGGIDNIVWILLLLVVVGVFVVVAVV